MCPLVTLHDRAEPVVVHFDCDQFPAGRAVMGSRQNAHHRPCRAGPWRTACLRSGHRRQALESIGAQVHGEFLSRNLSATWSRKRPRAPTRQCRRLCPPAVRTTRTRRSCDLGMSSPGGSARCRASCRATERYPVGPGIRKARSNYVGRTGFEPVTSSVSGKITRILIWFPASASIDLAADMWLDVSGVARRVWQMAPMIGPHFVLG